MLNLTPWRVVRANTAARYLTPWRTYAGWWNHNGHWFNLADHRTSNTLKVAYEEIHRGWYTPPLPIRTGDLLLDLGAHTGSWSILQAHNHPSAHVLAYEPDHDNYHLLVRNIKRNQSRAVPIQAGYWPGATYLESRKIHGNTGGNQSTPSPTGITPATSIRSILDAWGIKRVRCLKIDAEGAEFQLTRAELALCDSILIEIHGDKGDTRNLLRLLRESGAPFIAQIIHPSGAHQVINHNGHKPPTKSLSRPIPWRQPQAPHA